MAPSKTKFIKLKEWTRKMKDWTQIMKEWEIYGRVTVNSNALTPKQKLYFLRNSPTINYNDERFNRHYMGWSDLIVGSSALHNFAKTYININNYIATFSEPTLTNNIITNNTILTQ